MMIASTTTRTCCAGRQRRGVQILLMNNRWLSNWTRGAADHHNKQNITTNGKVKPLRGLGGRKIVDLTVGKKVGMIFPEARPMTWTVLGIESTCDDSCAALVRYENGQVNVLADERENQFATHAQFGGIVPRLSRLRHEVDLPIVVAKVLEKLPDGVKVDAVAVATVPGFAGSLKSGMRQAIHTARSLHIPLYHINHLHAHIFSPFIHEPTSANSYPFATLLVSGGHTLLVESRSVTSHVVMGSTLDIAIGDSIDKVARELHRDSLQGHGGVSLEQWARYGRHYDTLKLPVPMLNVPRTDLNFSFAGLTAATLRAIRSPEATEWTKEDVAREFQRSAFEHITRVLDKYLISAKARNVPLKSIVVCGGVASNLVLRAKLERLCTQKYGHPLLMPDPHYCADNAVMIAHAQYEGCWLNKTDVNDLTALEVENERVVDKKQDDKVTVEE